jgi:hypothetical protein
MVMPRGMLRNPQRVTDLQGGRPCWKCWAITKRLHNGTAIQQHSVISDRTLQNGDATTPGVYQTAVKSNTHLA